MLYKASNTRPDITFAVHQCDQFTHKTKASHEMDMNIKCHYLQDTNENILVFNSSKKLVVYCYADANFVGLWGHENNQDPLCARSRTGFWVTFNNCLLLCVSKP